GSHVDHVLTDGGSRTRHQGDMQRGLSIIEVLVRDQTKEAVAINIDRIVAGRRYVRANPAEGQPGARPQEMLTRYFRESCLDPHLMNCAGKRHELLSKNPSHDNELSLFVDLR